MSATPNITPLPWVTGEQNGHGGIVINGPDGQTVGLAYLGLCTSRAKWGAEHFALPENAEAVANAAFIVRACNSFDSMHLALVMVADTLLFQFMEPEIQKLVLDALVSARPSK